MDSSSRLIDATAHLFDQQESIEFIGANLS